MQIRKVKKYKGRTLVWLTGRNLWISGRNFFVTKGLCAHGADPISTMNI